MAIVISHHSFLPSASCKTLAAPRLRSLCPGKMEGRVAPVCMPMMVVWDFCNRRNMMPSYKLGMSFYMIICVTCQMFRTWVFDFVRWTYDNEADRSEQAYDPGARCAARDGTTSSQKNLYSSFFFIRPTIGKVLLFSSNIAHDPISRISWLLFSVLYLIHYYFEYPAPILTWFCDVFFFLSGFNLDINLAFATQRSSHGQLLHLECPWSYSPYFCIYLEII